VAHLEKRNPPYSQTQPHVLGFAAEMTAYMTKQQGDFVQELEELNRYDELRKLQEEAAAKVGVRIAFNSHRFIYFIR
jgi:hypothetical protein